MAAFADDRGAPGTRVWRRSCKGAWFSGCVAAGFALGALALVGLTGFLIAMPGMAWAAVVTGILALYLGALVPYLWLDSRGKSGGLIVLDDHGIRLDLVRGRSLMHRPPPVRETIAWPALRSVDHRLEGYATQGMAMLQRSYWLVRQAGEPVLLFEDRAMGTAYETDSMMPLAAEIVARGRIALNEREMAEGRGGLLGVWFARGPAFDAPAIAPAARRRIRRGLWLTGAAVSLAWLIVMLATVLGS